MLDEDLLDRDTQIAVERMTSFIAFLLVLFLLVHGARKTKPNPSPYLQHNQKPEQAGPQAGHV